MKSHFLVYCTILLAGILAHAGEITRVEPKESNELLANPGMGWQTFHQFADHDRNLKGLPSASAYFRFYWREIESADGKVDLAKIDGLIAQAKNAGQKLCLRIMCVGSDSYMDVPALVKDQGCKGTEVEYSGSKHWLPDFSDPIFIEKHARLIRMLGEHYDSNPDFDLLDIGSVGLWGEWHMSDVKETTTGKAVPMPTVETQNSIIDEWMRAFPKSPKAVLIGSDTGMARTVKDGLGWRADCLGDLGGFSKNWNHMQNFYPQALTKASAQDAWKVAPVAFESCWDMRKWKQEGWDIRAIFDFALTHHASYLNNKSAPIPDGAREEVERFLRRLGYRLVIRSLEHLPDAQAGGVFKLKIVWKNVGVAPPYRDYRVAIRLRDEKNTAENLAVLTSEESIRGLLPGSRTSDLSVTLPAALKAGVYELAVGIVDSNRIPCVRLAIEGRDNQGWYPLSKVQVVAK